MSKIRKPKKWENNKKREKRLPANDVPFQCPPPPLLPYTYTHTHPDDQIAKKKMGERNISNPVLSSPYKEIIFPVRTFFFFFKSKLFSMFSQFCSILVF
jgi:hypothetical protein